MAQHAITPQFNSAQSNSWRMSSAILSKRIQFVTHTVTNARLKLKNARLPAVLSVFAIRLYMYADRAQHVAAINCGIYLRFPQSLHISNGFDQLRSPS
jgi:hypothetical protein